MAVCVIDGDGRTLLERSIACDIEDITWCLTHLSAFDQRIGLEVGAISQHLFFGLRATGFDVVCTEARQVNAALSGMRIKTDKTAARGIANVLRSGWFSTAHMKSRAVHAMRARLNSRKAVLRKCTDLANKIRGLFCALCGCKRDDDAIRCQFRDQKLGPASDASQRSSTRCRRKGRRRAVVAVAKKFAVVDAPHLGG